MTKSKLKAAAAFMAATAAASLCLTACEGRKMSNMTPRGETVEVVVNDPADAPTDIEMPIYDSTTETL